MTTEVGVAYEDWLAIDTGGELMRSVLMTTAATRERVDLPSTAQIYLERYDYASGGPAERTRAPRPRSIARHESTTTLKLYSARSIPAGTSRSTRCLDRRPRLQQPVVELPRGHDTAPVAHAFVPHRLITPGKRPLRASA